MDREKQRGGRILAVPLRRGVDRAPDFDHTRVSLLQIKQSLPGLDQVLIDD